MEFGKVIQRVVTEIVIGVIVASILIVAGINYIMVAIIAIFTVFVLYATRKRERFSSLIRIIDHRHTHIFRELTIEMFDVEWKALIGNLYPNHPDYSTHVEGPFCPNCKNEMKLKSGIWECVPCKTEYERPKKLGYEAKEVVRRHVEFLVRRRELPTRPQIITPNVISTSVKISPGKYKKIPIPINIEGKTNAKFRGNFSAQGGFGDDVKFYVFDKQNFIKWQRGHKNTPLDKSGKIHTYDFEFPINASGTYYLVFDNKFSIVSDKIVDAIADILHESGVQ